MPLLDLPMPGDGSPMGRMQGMMWMPQQAPTLARVMAWHAQPVPVLPVLAAVALGLYLLGVVVLLRRGDRWPVGRTLSWLVGIATIVAVTGTAMDGYGMELFSIHMIQHMVLGMLAPVFLALGAPVTLLLRALPAGHGRRRSLRARVLWLLHTRFSRFISHPGVTLVLFLMSIYGLYFTPVFDYLMSTMWGHNLMLAHFVAIGWLYFWGVLGIDPSPRLANRGVVKAAGPILPLLELGATIPFHAFFGVVVMMSSILIVNFYATPMPGWGIDPLKDQFTGGGIAWAFTELPTLLVLGAMVFKWQKSDARRARAADRQAARDGDAQRLAYNAYLESLARRDASAPF